MQHAANAVEIEWPSPFRAGVANYDGHYRWLRERNQEAAGRWLVATYVAEWKLSDGYIEEFEKWSDRADRVERHIIDGTWDERY